MRFAIGRIAVLSLLVTALLLSAAAQSNPGPSGPDEFGAGQTVGVEHIDLATLNVTHDFPVFSKPGRGLSLNIHISHNSSLFAFNDNLGWQDELQNLTGYVTYSTPASKSSAITFVDDYGVSHPFSFNGSTYVANDGTGMTLTLNFTGPSVVTAENGAKFTVPTIPVGGSMTPGGIRQDANGNEITVTANGVTDTLGIQYPVSNPFNNNLINTSGGSSESASSYTPLPSTSFSYKDSTGAPRTATIAYGVFPFGYSQTQFLGSVPLPYNNAPCGTAWTPTAIQFVNLPQSITLANGQSYQIQYEQTTGSGMTFFYGNGSSSSYNGPYVTGRISKVTLPSGGIITYAYNAAGTDSCDGGVDYLVRTINGSQWTYSRKVTVSSGGQQVTTTVTDPNGTSTSYTFASQGLLNAAVYRLTSQSILGAGSTPTESVEICYNGASRPCASQISTPAIVSSRDVYTSYNSSAESRVTSTYVGKLYVPTERDEYDYGASAPSRKTIYQYHTLNGLQTNLVSSIVVEDGQGNSYSQTTIGYDESTPSPTSNVPQHVAITGQRGNLTSISRWSSTDSQWLVTSYKYDDTGDLQSSTDPTTTEVTTYSYADSWGSDASGCPVSGESLAFATSITDALGHVTRMTYDPCWGDQLSVKGPNDILNGRQGTLLGYDSVNNSLNASYPDGGETSISYNGYSLPLTKTTTTIASPNPSVVSTTVLDPLGRVSSSALTSDPYGAITTLYGYDPVHDSQPIRTSDPYRTSSDATYGHWATTSFDSLGRTISSCSPTSNGPSTCAQWVYNQNAVDSYDAAGHHSQYVLDGLGRTVKVFEPDANNNPTIETDYTYDPLDNVVRIDQWGGARGNSSDHVRRFAYDSLSRLVAEYSPEHTFVQPSPVAGYTQYPASLTCVPGGPWSTCYGYDHDNNLINRTDNRGTVTSLHYDKLNRVVSKTYQNDPSGTLSACFLYDVSPPGYSDPNPILALTAEWTQTGACPTSPSGPPTGAQTVRIVSSHDAMGRILGESQCPFAPCASLYPFAYTFDLAGDRTGSNNGLSGANAFSLNSAYDAAGRLGAVTSSWNDSTHPAILFQANASTASSFGVPYGPLGLSNAQYGVSSSTQSASVIRTLGYDIAGRLTNDSAVGSVLGATNAPYTGSVTISGTEGSYTRCQRGSCGQVWYVGTVSIPVGSFTASTNFGAGSTTSTLASSLAAALNTAGSPVTATASGSVVAITSKGGSLALSAVETGQCTCFAATASGASLTQYGQPNAASLYSYTVPSGGYGYNNNILSHSDSVTGQWSFGYDNMNRITSASATAGMYQGLGLAWTYDAFGNRLAQTPSGSSLTPVPPASWASFSTSNQVVSANSISTGFYYDAIGDVVNDGSNRYAFDAEGHLCAVYNSNTGSITGYAYDAEGRRVAKGTLSTLACNSGSFVLSRKYLLGPLGKQVTELDSGSNWIHSNVFNTETMIATYDAYGLHFHFSDPLGSRRIQVSAAANSTVTTDEGCASLPYGDGQSCTGSGSDSTEHHFTGKERDAESGNDYFGARYYASATGRFVSPDPSQLYYADPRNPQSLNLYSYALNNPLKNTDPTGMYCYYGATDGPEADDDEKDRTQFDYHSNEAECTKKDENGNQGQWIDDWGTHYEMGLGGVDDDDRQENYMMAPSLPQGVVGAPPLETANVSIDPDEQRIDALVQGIATDTASMPWLCNAAITVRGQLPRVKLPMGLKTPNVAIGASLDKNGLQPSDRVVANEAADGTQVNLTTNGKKVGYQISVPIPDTPFRGTLSTGNNQATVGLSRSLQFGKNAVSVGGSLTFGYLGDPRCRN